MDFTGKVAMVTGAAVGIGRATALEFGEKGADLVLLDMDADNLAKLEDELKPLGVKYKLYVADISDEARINEVVADAVSVFGKIDILVNNAAIFRFWKPFTETPMEIWKKFHEVNVYGTVYCIRAVIDGMLERKYGRIINVSSVAGVYGLRNMAPYSATKAAVNALTKSIAKEVVTENVLVNAVCPGSVSDSKERDVNYVSESDLPFIGRTGSDRENANVICFLASDEATYISGQCIQVDGCRRTM